MRLKSASVRGPVPARLPVRANVTTDACAPRGGIGLARGLPLHRATAQVETCLYPAALVVGPAVIVVDVIALDAEGGFVGIAEGQASGIGHIV